MIKGDDLGNLLAQCGGLGIHPIKTIDIHR